MADTTRTFVALAVPGKLGKKLALLQTLIAPQMFGARWVDPAHFHVTLAFLGDVRHADLNEVCKEVSHTAAGFDALDLRLEGLGVFPNPTKPRTLWVGLTGPGLEPLVALQKELAASLASAGYPPDDSRFHPHTTLARLKPGRGPLRDLNPLLNHYRKWSAGSFTVQECVTFASTLNPDGPIYTPLDRAPLRGRNREASG
jgi:2'-5' RNA ligase